MSVVCTMTAARVVVVVVVLAGCWGTAERLEGGASVAWTPKGNNERCCVQGCVCGSLDYNRLSEQSHRLQPVVHKSKTSPVTNTFPVCKGIISFNDTRSSKAYPFKMQTRRRKPRGTRIVLREGPTSLHDGQAQVTQRSKTFVNKYQPIEIFNDNRLTSPIYSSLLIEKGVAFSVFFWVYLSAFLYAACYLVSSFIAPFSILGFVMKVLLVNYFSIIINLEVFRVADYIMACALHYFA
ncbi:uncharacterized protein LOC123510542 [Portunus trituberculatus]|uniref:uncharacterized protein LOC123510542 n=1 Tax=Portunus trituberculatus TaxID=210409 RepID=UPI001E1CB595|nr:uncharacterized protein LOC123510542 [Portunus trituberculatus]